MDKLKYLLTVVDKLKKHDPDMTLQRLACFLAVCEKEPATSPHIQERVDLAQSSTFRNLALLGRGTRQHRGLNWLVTQEDPEDWRRKIYTLSPQGKKILQELQSAAAG